MNMTFADMAGQTKIKTLLENSIKTDRIMNSYIIEGDDGMGKKTLASIFAGYLVCETGTACGKCRNCMLYGAGNHPDVITVQKDDSKKTLDVASLRSSVMEFAYVKPYISRRKVIIIPEYGGIGASSQNALLKIIEEPPPYLTFILLVKNAAALLDTVRSRSIVLTLENYTMAEIMQATGIYSEFELSRLMCCADGNIGRIKQLMSDTVFAEKRDKTISLCACLFSKKHSDIFKLTDFFEENKNDADALLNIILEFFRDLLLIKSGKEELIFNTDYKEKLFSADYISTMKQCFDAANAVLRAKNDLNRNVNYSLCITAFAESCYKVLQTKNQYAPANKR